MVGEDDPNYRETIAGYDLLVEQADTIPVSPWGDSDYQKHYVWPAVRPLLPDVADKRVLDAGCGIGDYTGWFLESGATVVGVDASEQALTTARDRLGDQATFYRADLTESLDFAENETFDLVFSNLVLDHIEHWNPVLEGFYRVLTTDGVLVFTTIHPLRRYQLHQDEVESYYTTEAYVKNWGGTGAQIASYHRPIGEIINALTRNGFTIDEFQEPTPPEEYEKCNPERYKKAMNRPDLLCVRAVAQRS